MADPLVISIPLWVKQRRTQHAVRDAEEATPTALQAALARAFSWRRLLDAGDYAGIQALAGAVGCDPSYIARLLNLTLLAPDLVPEILGGGPLAHRPITRMPKALPVAWPAQRALLQGVVRMAAPLATVSRCPDYSGCME